MLLGEGAGVGPNRGESAGVGPNRGNRLGFCIVYETSKMCNLGKKKPPLTVSPRDHRLLILLFLLFYPQSYANQTQLPTIVLRPTLNTFYIEDISIQYLDIHHSHNNVAVFERTSNKQNGLPWHTTSYVLSSCNKYSIPPLSVLHSFSL